MLQQTRVEAVVEPYSRFIAAFPTLSSLARAEEAQVLARWSGLGYYRRARRLHAGARFVVEHHRGRVPRTRVELEKVPGIGAYTAGALLSIAFGERESALDANVTRVVARLYAVQDAHTAAGRRTVARLASALVDCRRPGDVNEALMDLGSALCTAGDARCHLCPMVRVCGGHATGEAAAIAAPRARKPPRLVELACAVVRDGDRVLFLRRPDGDALLGGLWDLPTVESVGAESARALRELLQLRSGIDARLREPLLSVRHDIIGRKIVASVYVTDVGAATSRRGRRLPIDARLLAAADMQDVGLPALPLKILRALDRRAPARSS
jgi:A/G-specific adenine glycosylase